ncbi:MAG: protein kinase [Bowdeniella nasicola]|nr:protein kinase [Bowdeniella nasicola]
MMEEFGGYLLGEEIGRGGMGTVRRAIDADGNAVAVKILHPAIAADPQARARLAREVATLRRVRGEGVARVVDAEVDDTDAFIVTELIDGPTLQADVESFGSYQVGELAELATGLFTALTQIHAAGVVHRDLKPSNVMMGVNGPVLIDFGIAQVADDARLTHTGLVAGTVGYLDPQALAGADPTPAGDWWSWAAVLVFAATGRPPFGRGPLQAIMARVHAGRVDVQGLAPEIADPLTAALAPDPAHRPHPTAVLTQLQDVATGQFRAPGITPLPAAASSGSPTETVGVDLGGDDNPTRLLPSDSDASAALTQPLAPTPPRELSDLPPTQQLPEPNPTQVLPTAPAGLPAAPPVQDHLTPDPIPAPLPYLPPRAYEPAPTPWVMATAWLALSAAALHYPVAALGVLIGWIALTGVIGNGINDHRAAVLRFGARMGDAVRIIGRGAVHLIKHGLSALWHTTLAVMVLAIALGFLRDGDDPTTRTVNMALIGAATGVAAFIVWLQPSARWARYANRSLIHTIFPSGTARTALCLALLTLAIILALTALAQVQPVQWWPLDTIKSWFVQMIGNYS